MFFFSLPQKDTKAQRGWGIDPCSLQNKEQLGLSAVLLAPPSAPAATRRSHVKSLHSASVGSAAREFLSGSYQVPAIL